MLRAALVACAVWIASPSLAAAQTVTALGAARAIVDLEVEDRETLEEIRVKHQQASVYYVEAAVAGAIGAGLLVTGLVYLGSGFFEYLFLPIGSVAALGALVFGLVGGAIEGGARGQRDQLLDDTGLALEVRPSESGVALSLRGAF